MLTENEIVQTLVEYLSREGYRIDKQLTTLEQGIDIDAIHLATGRRLLIQAKVVQVPKRARRASASPFPRIKLRVTLP